MTVWHRRYGDYEPNKRGEYMTLCGIETRAVKSSEHMAVECRRCSKVFERIKRQRRAYND